MTEQDLIYQLQLDEPIGSLRAYDYSRTRSHADLTPTTAYTNDGQRGRALRLDGTALATSYSPVLLGQDFTIALHVITDNTRATRNLTLETQSDSLPFTIATNEWQSIIIVKSGMLIEVYINGLRTAFATLASQPQGLEIHDPLSATSYADLTLDGVLIYQAAATQEEVLRIFNYRHPHVYTLDGLPLIPTYNTYVEASAGILDRPKRKQTLSHSWPEYHGQTIDLAANIVEPRTITLNCWMPARDRIHFEWQWNDLIQHLAQPGLHRLQLDIHPNHPLCYDIYLADSLAITKQWRESLMVGKFTLKLAEPQPVKRVVRFRCDDPTTMQHAITLHSDTMLDISWGDGTHTNDIGATPTASHDYTIQHTYADTGIYYAVIKGDIQNLTNFTSTGITVWQII